MINKIEINEKLTRVLFTKNQKEFNMNEIYCPDCGKLLQMSMEGNQNQSISNAVNKGRSKLVGACVNCGCIWSLEVEMVGKKSIKENDLIQSDITSIELIEKELTELNERKTKLFNFLKSENLINISSIEKNFITYCYNKSIEDLTNLKGILKMLKDYKGLIL